MTSAELERRQRWGALLALAAGLLVLATLLVGSSPQDQILVFRLPRRSDASATRLAVQFTPVGASEPLRGFALSILSPQPRELRHRVRMPNGDYMVAADLTWEYLTGPSAPAKTETRGVHRVRLLGNETLVALDAKGLD